MNPSEFERNKPTETYKAIMNAKVKYEALLKETVIMDESDATKVDMAAKFLKDLKKIYDNNGSNPYLSNEDLIEDKYYQFKGQ